MDTSINDIKVRKPNAFWYYLISLAVKLLATLRFHLRVKNEIKGLKAPFVLLANHSSVADVAFTVGSFLPHRINIVASTDLFTWKVFKPFIEKLGCIRKSQCSIDILSLKTMKAAIEQGRNIIIYPEGRTSLDGKELHYVPNSVGKFLKMMDATVAFSYTQGSYLTKPRYFHGFRRGKILLTKKVLLTKEQVETMSVAEISDVVREALRFNDNIYQRENHIRFKSKSIAAGLDYILYKCPKCGAEYEMHSTNTQLVCDACGNTVTYTEYGELIPDEGSVAFDRIDLWYDFERKSVDEELNTENFYIEKPVTMLEEVDRNYETVGEGKLYIDGTHIGYTGTRRGEPFGYKVPLKTMNAVITKNEEGIDLVHDEITLRFLFTEHKYSTKYGLIVEQLYRKNVIDKQLKH